MSILELKGAIVENLNGLNEEQLSMLLQIVEDLAPQDSLDGNHWDNPEFVVEMNRRTADWKANPDSMRTADQVQDAILARLRDFRNKNIA